MKVLIFIISLLSISVVSYAQAPQSFNYQGVARDGSGSAIVSAQISLRIAIIRTPGLGTEVYKETHSVQTSSTGVFSVQVGRGTIQNGTFEDIDWGAGEYNVQIELDPAGGSNFTLMGASQLLSVPYALFAANDSGNMDFWKENNKGIHFNEGNVGIGTSNPDVKLTIEGDDPVLEGRNYIRLYNKSLSNRSNVYISLSAGDDENQTFLNHSSETYDIDGFKYADFGQLENRGGGLNYVAYDHAGIHRFFTGRESINNNPIERMRLSSNGHLGIGTIDPISKLTIEGDDPLLEARNYIRLYNKSLSPRSNVYISLSAGDDEFSTYLNHNSETYDIDGFQYADFGQLENRGGGLNLVAHNDLGVLRFFTAHDPVTNYPLERMRLSNDGNFGIGSTTPAAKVHVAGGDVYIEDINNGVIMKSPNGSCWRMTINDDGSVQTSSIPCPN